MDGVTFSFDLRSAVFSDPHIVLHSFVKDEYVVLAVILFSMMVMFLFFCFRKWNGF